MICPVEKEHEIKPCDVIRSQSKTVTWRQCMVCGQIETTKKIARQAVDENRSKNHIVGR